MDEYWLMSTAMRYDEGYGTFCANADEAYGEWCLMNNWLDKDGIRAKMGDYSAGEYILGLSLLDDLFNLQEDPGADWGSPGKRSDRVSG